MRDVILFLGVLLVAGAVIAIVGITSEAQARIAKHGKIKLLWRYLSGNSHDGKPVTDAGWLRPGVRALTPTGHAPRFWHLPRWKRAARRSGRVSGVLLALILLLAAPAAVAWTLAALAAAGFTYAGWRLWRIVAGRKHRKTWLLPLHLAAHELAGHPRAALASSWIRAELDSSGAVARAELSLPQGWPADKTDKGKLIAVTAAKLAIESPEVSWRQAGPQPRLILCPSQPPPKLIGYEAVREAVESARSHEVIAGVGKKASIVKVSLTGDSPHFGLSMGSGGGKSTLAAFLLMQELRRGAIALVLDAKWISHPWLVGMPNVAYARTPAQMHRAMIWLGEELDRRNQVALNSVDLKGVVRANVGPRLFIVAEELNLAVPRLTQYWADVRDRDDVKRSPALTGLSDVAFAGRQVKMHLVLIGQMLTAKATGGVGGDSSVRENIGVKFMARYSSRAWQMMAPEHPMPASPSVVGRVQVVTAHGVRETQVPLVDLEMARDLVMGGEVTPCPAGMPGRQLPAGETTGTEIEPWDDSPPWPADVTVSGNGPRPIAPKAVTLSEAVAMGILHPETTLGALRMARHRGDLPPHTGLRGLAQEFDPAALTAWDLDRRAARQ